MKKSVLMWLFCLTMPLAMMAQKGIQSVGVNVPIDYRKNNLSFGIGVKYQYNFSDSYRMEVNASYSPLNSCPEKEWLSTEAKVGKMWNEWENREDAMELKKAQIIWQGNVNTHFFLMSPHPIRPYIILGVGFAQYVRECKTKYQEIRDDISQSLGAFRFGIGIGTDLRIGYRWGLQMSVLAIKPLYINHSPDPFKKNELNGQVNGGLTYIF